jgi:CheY-like chemotaxis protein
MLRACYYKGCGVVYGEIEPLSDTKITHGLCPRHYEISLRELKSEMEKLRDKTGAFKVLVVEDSALFRQLLKERLRERFPSVGIYEAGDEEGALQKVEPFRPNLIFMDIRLPKGNGLDLTKRIKALHPNMIIVILTAHDLPEYREASQKYADYFFSKGSVATENIFALVQSILSTGG